MVAIVINGADFSGSNAPRSERYIQGIPATNLVGYWPLMSGTLNAADAGPYPDVSGQGNDMTLYTGRASPTQRSYGLEVADVDGVAFTTPISSGLQEFTLLAAAKPLLPGSESGVYGTLFGATENSLPATDTDSHPAHPYPVLNINGQQALASGNDNAGLYDQAGDVVGSTRIALADTSALQVGSIYGLRISASAPSVKLRDLAGNAISSTDAGIATYFDGTQTGYMQVGWWPFTTGRTATTPQAQLYGFALYNAALTDAQIARAMAGMATQISARGVVLTA